MLLYNYIYAIKKGESSFNLIIIFYVLDKYPHQRPLSFCLQAVESIRAVVALCDSADEELRHVAIETLLTFGE